MDYVRFRRRRLADFPTEVIDIVVNERELPELVGELERPFAEVEGSPSIAGSYIGLRPDQLDGSPGNHFLGSAHSHLSCGPEAKTVLLGCECGEPGCWPLMARIDARPDAVIWADFEQPHRDDWQYGGLRLTFDRRQYEAALAEITIRETH